MPSKSFARWWSAHQNQIPQDQKIDIALSLAMDSETRIDKIEGALKRAADHRKRAMTYAAIFILILANLGPKATVELVAKIVGAYLGKS